MSEGVEHFFFGHLPAGHLMVHVLEAERELAVHAISLAPQNGMPQEVVIVVD